MNEDNSADRLEILRAKYEQEIRGKEQELHALKAKLANLVEFAQESAKLTNSPEENPDKYANAGLSYAVLDAVHSLLQKRQENHPRRIRRRNWKPHTGSWIQERQQQKCFRHQRQCHP